MISLLTMTSSIAFGTVYRKPYATEHMQIFFIGFVYIPAEFQEAAPVNRQAKGQLPPILC
jgi:hypothetical protein